MSGNPRSHTNRSGRSRSRNCAVISMPAASCDSTNSRSNSSMRTSRCPGRSVYWRSSTTGQHPPINWSADGVAPLDRLGSDRRPFHDVDDWDDVELEPWPELGGTVEQVESVVGLDDRIAPVAVHPCQELVERVA